MCRNLMRNLLDAALPFQAHANHIIFLNHIRRKFYSVPSCNLTYRLVYIIFIRRARGKLLEIVILNIS